MLPKVKTWLWDNSCEQSFRKITNKLEKDTEFWYAENRRFYLTNHRGFRRSRQRRDKKTRFASPVKKCLRVNEKTSLLTKYFSLLYRLLGYFVIIHIGNHSIFTPMTTF
ncbi:hypothetical protein RF11_15462 [Thelohanellus kitauei]|uniref:Uncharacterized protein n=1 Tax=Thelohanellus kitauei TaxID=669202 RepID=A0A0C2I9R6_THEKT|nr:hypothetical protein RF11_15462 [Thelohanellus kitauei]